MLLAKTSGVSQGANTNLKAVEEDGDDDVQEEDALQRLENQKAEAKTRIKRVTTLVKGRGPTEKKDKDITLVVYKAAIKRWMPPA